MIQITVLGCGTSTGVPIIGCKCQVCQSKNRKNKRSRASIWVQTQKKSLLIDASTDFRTQALTHQIPKIDALLLTHSHSDHISGIDDLRCYNFIQKKSIPVFGNQDAKRDLFKRYDYIFKPNHPHEGGAVADLEFHLIRKSDQIFKASGVEVTPLPVDHGSKLKVLGFRIHDIAYLTDCSYIPEQSLKRMRDLSVLILDCVRIKPHRTHLNLEQALEVVKKVKPRKTYLTHLGHDFDYSTWNSKLPSGVQLAYDGMTVKN